MKSILVRSLALATLASSISAFAAAAPSRDDPPKEENMSTAGSPADARSSEKATEPMESSVFLKLDQLEKEVHQLEIKDNLNQEEKQKTIQKDKGKIRQDNKEWDHSLLGIYG